MIMELSGYALNMTTREDMVTTTEAITINGTLAAVLTGTSREEALDIRRVPLLKQTAPVTVLLSVAYSVVFLLAVVNNSLVVTVIYRNPQMRNVTNYFLANLAIADITVSLVVLPITLLSNIFTEWHFGPFFCKAIPYLQAVAVSASVNTLVAVAMERYFAIFHPQKTVITPNRAVVIIAIIWLIPMCMQVPWALFYNQVEYRSPTAEGMAIICYPRFPSKNFERLFFLGAVFLACYLVPLFFICVCYSLIGIKVWKRSVSGIRGTKAERNIQRSKIRIVRMLVVVAFFFTFSWLALYSIRMRILYGSRLVGAEKKIVQNILFPLAQWFGAANSCVNPFVYCYFSEQFRKGFAALLSKDSCCRKIKFESLRLTSPQSGKESQQK